MFNTSSIALIVGGSSGMGKATAERLLKAGVPVMILSHDKNNLAEAKQDLESVTKGQVETAQVDLYDPSAVKSFIEQLNAENVILVTWLMLLASSNQLISLTTQSVITTYN